MSNEIRTAIVTGASKGIGAAVAKRLAADGFRTVVNFASSAAEAEEVVAVIKAAGGRAMAVGADVADASAVRRLFDQAEAEFGPVDVLVNNAGIMKASPLAEVADADYQRQVAVDHRAFNGMREGARRVRDGGRIINVSTSIIGYYIANHVVYADVRTSPRLPRRPARRKGAAPLACVFVRPALVAVGAEKTLRSSRSGRHSSCTGSGPRRRDASAPARPW